MRQPVSRAASRAFWPSLPIASESWKSGTTTRAVLLRASSTVTETTLDGDSALPTKVAGSSDQSMMSIFSPASSLITPRTLAPTGPMQAPFGLTPGTVDRTAILDRWPASRATATISTEPSTISGTSSANSLRTRFGCVRLNVICGPAHSPRHPDDVAADPLAVLVASRRAPARPAAARPRSAPDSATIDHAARVGPGVALHDAGDDLALLGGELAVGPLVLGVAQPLQDDLARGGGGDPAEALRGVVPLGLDAAVRGQLLGDHPHRAGLAVDVDPGVRLVAVGVLVGGEQRRLDGLDAPSRTGCPCPARWCAARRCRRSCRLLLLTPDVSSSSSASGAGRNSTCTPACSTSA